MFVKFDCDCIGFFVGDDVVITKDCREMDDCFGQTEKHYYEDKGHVPLPPSQQQEQLDTIAYYYWLGKDMSAMHSLLNGVQRTVQRRNDQLRASRDQQTGQ